MINLPWKYSGSTRDIIQKSLKLALFWKQKNVTNFWPASLGNCVCFNVFFFLFSSFVCLLFLLSWLWNFDFTIYFYILVLYPVSGKHKLGNSIVNKIVVTAEFLTVGNTHGWYSRYINLISFELNIFIYGCI